MDMYYYNLNGILKKNKWIHPKIISYHSYKVLYNNCQDIRF